MKLDRVTITGADDNTNPADLIVLSRAYPFVEWGILVSKRQEGSPRFPSRQWCENYATAVAAVQPPVQTSTHICGVWVRQLLGDKSAGAFSWTNIPDVEAVSQRIQINTHAQPHEFDAAIGAKNMRAELLKPTFIFQIDGVNDHLLQHFAREGIACAGLYDRSGGSGTVPGFWPAPASEYQCGYAGGLGPETIADQLPLIATAAGDATVWVDMEYRVRSPKDVGPGVMATDDVLDLEKVRQVLDFCAQYRKA